MSYEAIKDPAEKLDYTIDYSILFAESDPDDQIVSSTWAITSLGTGLVIDSSTILDFNKAVVWVSAGGVLGTIHKLTNHVICVSTREYERTIRITIRNK